MNFKLTLGIAAFSAALALSACDSKTETTASEITSAAPVTEEKLASDQTYIYRQLDEITSFDPQLIEDVDGSIVGRDLFEGLVNQDENGSIVPGVAESWEISENNTKFVFKLRDSAKWSNGNPVTAHDFVYAWQRLADPEFASPYSWFMEIMYVENAGEIIAGEKAPETLGAVAVDDLTLEVKLSQSLPYFVKMLSHTSTFPVPKDVVETLGKDWTKPGSLVGNGAYVLEEHVVNERSVRVRNENYWDNENTVIDKVIALVINDENQAYNRFKAGEVHKTDIPAGQFKRVMQENPDETFSMPQLCSYYYLFNTTRAPFDNPDVRKALAYSIDRAVIADQILAAGQTGAYFFTPPKTDGFVAPEVDWSKKSQAELDAEARELLAKAGYGVDNPLKLSILYNTSEDHKKIAIAISQMWKTKLGVETTLENQEWKTYLDTRRLPDYDVARAGWCGDYNEASTFLTLLMSDNDLNDSKWKSTKYDELLTSATVMSDPNVNYTLAEQMLADAMPIAPIYHYAEDIAISKNLKGWPFNNIEQNMYSKDMYLVE